MKFEKNKIQIILSLYIVDFVADIIQAQVTLNNFRSHAVCTSQPNQRQFGLKNSANHK